MNLVRDSTDAVWEFGGVGVNLSCGCVSSLHGPAILLNERTVRQRVLTDWKVVKKAYVDVYIYIACILQAERDELVGSCDDLRLGNVCRVQIHI